MYAKSTHIKNCFFEILLSAQRGESFYLVGVCDEKLEGERRQRGVINN